LIVLLCGSGTLARTFFFIELYVVFRLSGAVAEPHGSTIDPFGSATQMAFSI
jgi:hypothetical protein